MLYLLITVRQRGCGKVIFQMCLSVSHSVHSGEGSSASKGISPSLPPLLYKVTALAPLYRAQTPALAPVLGLCLAPPPYKVLSPNIFKLVQLGPHFTGSWSSPGHAQACSTWT